METRVTPMRCEPPAELRGVDGWHWLKCTGTLEVRLWSGKYLAWQTDDNSFYGNAPNYSPTEAAQDSYRYIAPVPDPAAVAALVTAARDAAETLATLYGAEDEPCATLLAALAAFPQPKDT